MSDKRAVRVGDMVNGWNLSLPEYDGCEFRAFAGSSKVQITKVPERKPEIPDEPMTRGSVVTIEGDDWFIAVRFTEDEDLLYPFVGVYSGTSSSDFFDWGDEIVSRAAGRKIIVHKMVDRDKIPASVSDLDAWNALPPDELKKYKWRDVEGDLWWYDPSTDAFLAGGEQGEFGFGIEEFFPLTRCEKIG